MIYVLLIATEPPLRGRVAIHCTSKLGVCSAIVAKVVLTAHVADRVIELAFVFCAHVAQVRTSYLPEPGSLVYSSVTTDVDKLGLKTNTLTKEGKDVRWLASGWTHPLVTSFCPLLAGRGTS